MRQWLFALLLPLCLHAGGWDPVPPETWSIRPESTKGSAGAIFLLDWSRYGVNDTEHRLRILILSEAGKSAVQLDPFSPLLDKVEGRTLYPDGKETDFNKAEDFSNQVVSRGSDDVTRKIIVPPGLTDHCIVDLHWSDRGTVLWGNRFDRQILRSYPIRNLELQLSTWSPLGSVWVKPTNMAIEVSENKDYHIYKFKDLPALEPEPYSREAWLFRPKLMCFKQPRLLFESISKTPDVYWQAAAKKIIQTDYQDKIEVGRKYRALAQDILSGLPEDPIQKAQEIQNRLYMRILNINAMTATERAARTKNDEKATVHSMDLDEAADRKWTNSTGMFYLAYKLFVEAGLQPKILFVANRDERGFRYGLLDFYQFDHVLLGIDSADGKGIMLCDPSIRLLPAGIIDPSYQGTLALLVDSKDWSARPYQIPFQSSGLNRQEYEYEVSPGDAEDHFKVRGQFYGFEEWAERFKYFSLTQKDAERHLKEELESSRLYTVTRETVTNRAERNTPMTWEAEGTRESDEGRRREVNPFPTLKCPLWIPSAWPEHRTDPVVMYYVSLCQSTSRIHIPDGWRASLPEPMEQGNQLGKVSWIAKEVHDDEGTTVVVSYQVNVTTTFANASAESALRNLLSWVEDGWNRRIRLEKIR